MACFEALQHGIPENVVYLQVELAGPITYEYNSWAGTSMRVLGRVDAKISEDLVVEKGLFHGIVRTRGMASMTMWFKDGLLHRDQETGLPAVDGPYGRREFRLHGKLHRDNDLPAVEGNETRTKGYGEWWQDGLRHREGDLPAFVKWHAQMWWRRGVLHRDGDLPAVIDGKKMEWWKDGVRHRDGDMPAIIDVHLDGVGVTKEWWSHGQRHRDGDRPAFTKTAGTFDVKEWWCHGKRHRDGDLPAFIQLGKWKMQEWYKNGETHRDGDLPARIWSTPDEAVQEWWWHGRRHRDYGPAKIIENVRQEWWKHGQLHRDRWPAVVWKSGRGEFWIHGVRDYG